MTAPAVIVVLLPVYVVALGALLRSRTGDHRVERQIRELRSGVAGYRAAHEVLTTSLDRRLDGLEQTTAQAANELRMASHSLIHLADTESDPESLR